MDNVDTLKRIRIPASVSTQSCLPEELNTAERNKPCCVVSSSVGTCMPTVRISPLATATRHRRSANTTAMSVSVGSRTMSSTLAHKPSERK